MEILFTDFIAQLSVEHLFYLAAWCSACSVFVAVAPVKITQKLPDWLMVVINFCAANVGNAVNKWSDKKGNPNGTANKPNLKGD